MCGISGFIDFSHSYSKESLNEIVSRMTDSLYHRGPDAGGIWVEAEAGIALGHRRLSIIDLSQEGHQPMFSPSENFVIVYNGEIYNYRELRNDLEHMGFKFRGHSDTEVILASIEQWGLEAALKRFVGMFAFALWDRTTRQLSLARDRLGEKPLYYGFVGSSLLFSSELKALVAHPEFKAEVDRDSLALYLRHNYVPTPYTIYRNFYKLPPGTSICLNTNQSRYLPEPRPYWSMEEVLEKAESTPFKGDENEAVEELDYLLRQVIKNQMISDVPLGAFLSGGIDSSMVVAIMQAINTKPVKTFSIGFSESGYNEADYAKKVANHLCTDHTELYITPEEAMAVIPKLPFLYDEPFSDSSQIPTYLVASLAKKKVTVSLSGDGGDELFGGYNRYFWARDIWRYVGWIPRPIRKQFSRGITTLSPESWNNIFTTFNPVFPKAIKQQLPGDKLHKLAEVLAVNSPQAMYQGLISHWKRPESIINGAIEPPTAVTRGSCWINQNSIIEKMMYLDTISYLPDDILIKVDRACMGVSLESRVPFLDHRVVEYAWRLPLPMKVRGTEGKYILKKLLERYVPSELIDRPKMGFGVPIGSWLRGPLKGWANNLLDENRLKREGFFNPEPITRLWQEHLSGRRNWQYLIWDILMFESWLTNNVCTNRNG